MSNLFLAVTAAFTAAKTKAAYENAKKNAARLSIPEQFEMVDSIIASRRRLEASGVL